jgi:predicted ATP-grasp superfamily ATP-dependent carboligase
VGLTAHSRIYGNFTRHAKTRFAPDSRHQPEELAQWLIAFGQSLNERAVLFPTRDDDLLFLDRFRDDLKPYFSLVMPETESLRICMDKYETYRAACAADVPVPKCWMLDSVDDISKILPEVTFPCVLKPVSAADWRRAGNWNIVGARKAIGVNSEAQLRTEYRTVSQATPQALLQEMVTGADTSLVIAACYMDKHSNLAGGFTAQKLVQVPEGFGTGCIVQVADRPELFERTVRLLKAIRFSGVAEVEYKWDAAASDYKLIEVNPRPWDQHTLGRACGVDVIYMAYREHAGLPFEKPVQSGTGHKWIAEDTFATAFLRYMWRRDPKLRSLLSLAQGNRTYAIGSVRDPVPAAVYFTTRYLPDLAAAGWRFAASTLRQKGHQAQPAENENRI